jgi:ribonuclease HI
MEKFKVNIYTDTSFHGPAKRDGAAGFQAEFITQKGTPVIYPKEINERFLWQWDTTEAELTLHALIGAFSMLTKPCDVTIYTNCSQVRAALLQNWPEKWEENGWMGSNGQEIKHADLWGTLCEEMEQHTVQIAEEKHHEYSEWMKAELARKEREMRTVPVTGTLEAGEENEIRLS